MAVAIENKLEASTRAQQARGPRASTTIRFLVLLFFCLLVLLPVYVLIVTSFKGQGDATAANAWSLPTRWVTENWKNAWSGSTAIPAQAPGLLRSIALVVPASLISAILGSMNGYVFAKWRFPYSNLVFTFILFGMFLPYQAVMVPLVQLMLQIDFIPSGIPQLIFLHVVYGIPITTLIFRNYYTSIPQELIEAARVDGAGFFRAYRSVVLPNSVPGFVVVLIWQFTSIWNDFLFAVFFTNASNGPVTITLNNLAQGSILANYGASMAGALIASFPTILVYILLGRYFVGGLMAGSVKA
jgi:glucose/mannose transport system permease protein